MAPGADGDAPLPRDGARDGRRSRSRCWRPPRCATPATAPEFVAALQARMPGVPIRILSGGRRRELSADGVLCGIPAADGILADIGGGSLEVVRLDARHAGACADAAARRDPAGGALRRRSGARAGDRRGGPRRRAVAGRGRRAATSIWSAAPGGRWRASTWRRPATRCSMVHHYTIGREEARDLAGVIAGAGRRALERLPGRPRRRIDDLPFAAVVLRRLLRATGARRVVFSANGLREGWFMRRMPAGDPRRRIRCSPPRRTAPRGSAATRPAAGAARLDRRRCSPARRARGAAAARGGVLDVGHRQPRPSGIPRRAGLPARAAPAGHRARPPRARLPRAGDRACATRPTRTRRSCARRALLLDVASDRIGPRCWGWRCAWPTRCRPARRTCWPAPALLLSGGRLVLRLQEDSGVFAGESVLRRLDRLAQALGLDAATEAVREQAA